MGTLRTRFHKGITFGIEYTYVFKDNPRNGNLVEAFSTLVNYEFKKKCLRVASHYDGGALEINSPPFSTLGQAEKFFNKMEEVVCKYPLVAKPAPKFRVCGGGGHIHFKPPGEFPRQRALLFAKLARFLTLHPYIAWMFNEWGDILTAKNFNEILWNKTAFPVGAFMGLTHDLTQMNKYDIIRREYNPSHFRSCMADKNHVLRYDEGEGKRKPFTIEFRAFDAKETFQDVEDHILFCNAMIAWVDKQRAMPVSPYNTKSKFLALGEKDRGVDEFRKVLRLLELPLHRYERFYKNYYLRAKNERLV